MGRWGPFSVRGGQTGCVGHRVSLRALGPCLGAPSPHPNALAHHTVRLHRPFFRGPLVQEEAIPDRKLKYFSSKNPATSACFWRFLGSTGRTRNGGRVCWGRSQRPVLGPAAPGGGLSNGNLSASTLPPSTLPCPPYLPRSPHSPRLWEKAGLGRSPGHPGTQKVAQQGWSSGPGNWLKGSFLPHILLSAGGPQPAL